MECAGCRRTALYMLQVGRNGNVVYQPHCHTCFEQAADSIVPVPVMSMDAYERMMKGEKQRVGHNKAS